MSKDAITFSIHNLLIEAKPAERELFSSVQTEIRLAQNDGVSGRTFVENTDLYLWMYATSGKNKPYSTEVLNVKTNECEDNPRNEDQAELRNQCFSFYDYRRKLLYVASGGVDYFRRVFNGINPNIVIRNLYKSREEFLGILKRVSKVKFVVDRDLLTWNSYLFAQSGDLFGLGDPSQISLEMRFPYVKLTKRFLDFVSGGKIGGCEASNMKSLIVAGRSGDGDRLIESTFNLKTLESSITIQTSKNEAGMYDSSSVLNALLSQLGR